MGLLSGKTVLVTGALGSIGRVIVDRYREESASVIALDLPGKEEVAATLFSPGSDLRYFGCDLSDLAATEKSVEDLADEVGGIDVVVHSAMLCVHKPHEEFTIEEYERHVRINSSATFVVSRACSKHMKQKGHGKIICLTSISLNGQFENLVPYVASKGASFGLIKSMARELGKYGINVNGISPGSVRSDAEIATFGHEQELFDAKVLAAQSIKRRIEPIDVAYLAIFLSSAQSDMISGQNIQCNGGW